MFHEHLLGLVAKEKSWKEVRDLADILHKNLTADDLKSIKHSQETILLDYSTKNLRKDQKLGFWKRSDSFKIDCRYLARRTQSSSECTTSKIGI